MLKKMILSITILVLLSSCTLVRTQEVTKEVKETQTITKTTELREVIAEDGSKIVLKTDTYEEAISEEVAEAERDSKVSVPLPSPATVGKGVLASLGIPPSLIDSIMLALGLYGGKKGYDTVRDANPRKHKPQPMKELT